MAATMGFALPQTLLEGIAHQASQGFEGKPLPAVGPGDPRSAPSDASRMHKASLRVQKTGATTTTGARKGGPQQSPPPQQSPKQQSAVADACGEGNMMRALSSQSSGQTSASSANKGAISQLQEYVQGAKLFPMPPNCPVLQWGYDSRMLTKDSLEFRATVSFMLDGIPHHVAGSWKHNKVLAKRDAAERTLGLFVNRWATVAVQDLELWTDPPSLPSDAPLREASQAEAPTGAGRDERQLHEFCVQALPDIAVAPQWDHTWEGDMCQAFAVIRLFGVPHTFPGKPKPTKEAAYDDAARRALWYLQCPGYEDLFEPDPEYVKAAAQTIPEASPSWCRDGSAEDREEQQIAERKTIVMRVQNRLMQAFAQQLKAGGSSVWFWSYERHPRDKEWPPLYCATVHVPLVGKTFTGTWTRGQREAQIEACTKIADFLDTHCPRTKGS